MIPRLFGTNGIRGIIGQDMSVDLALRMGKSIGSVFEPGPVAVGRDTRTSGPMLRDAAVAGLLATGHDVVDTGVLPTPGLQYFVHTGTFSGGVMITASHNPAEFNGIKVVDAHGMELARPEEEGIEARYFREDFALADWKGVGHVRADAGAVGTYLEGILSRVDGERIRAARLRVVVDCANAASCGTSPALISRLGCEVISMNGHPDGTFPGRPPEPVRENLGALMREVRGSKADLGVAHDGDADRAIFVDGRGEFVFGDRSLALVAKDIVSKRGGVVVTPVSTSQCLEDVVRASGGSVVYTKVGAPIVARVMHERGAVFGGEENGGMIFPEHQLCRDGAMSLAKVLEIVAKAGRPLSELLAELPAYSLHKTSVRYRAPERDAILVRLKALASGMKVEDIDGIKVHYADGWVLVRPSGTEPIFRIFAEAPTPERAKALADDGEALLKRAIAGA
ncbi:MAG: phosphoglucosamine mutase [Methanobacteriota archaeon]|nr:MAG: phosphoglucosamine mutase [Euryarchaeota archaeon]